MSERGPASDKAHESDIALGPLASEPLQVQHGTTRMLSTLLILLVLTPLVHAQGRHAGSTTAVPAAHLPNVLRTSGDLQRPGSYSCAQHLSSTALDVVISCDDLR